MSVPVALRLEVEDFYAAYIETLDDGEIEQWPDFFAEDCSYKLIARENWDRGLPLATIWCESKGMLRDRVYAWTRTLTFIPRHYRHMLSNLRIAEMTGTEDDPRLTVRANYLVIQSTTDDLAKVASAGKYLDTLVREAGRLKFREKLSIFDSALIANSVTFPV
jgi:3-phenylpropionate/cinnamic acid dioxygenase small subunit